MLNEFQKEKDSGGGFKVDNKQTSPTRKKASTKLVAKAGARETHKSLFQSAV